MHSLYQTIRLQKLKMIRLPSIYHSTIVTRSYNHTLTLINHTNKAGHHCILTHVS